MSYFEIIYILLFRDSVTVYVNAIMYYRVVDAVKVKLLY